MSVILRRDLSRLLTNREMDSNFQNLDLGISRLLYPGGVLPALDATFAGARFLPPDFTFARASTATYLENGVLKTAAANAPVFEGDRLRLETDATQYLTNTGVGSLGLGTFTGAAVAINIDSPDGALSAIRLSGGFTSAPSVSVTNPTGTFAMSWIVRGVGATSGITLALLNTTAATTLANIVFNPLDGTFTGDNPATGPVTVKVWPNGWWRVSISVLSGAAAGDVISVCTGATTNTAFASFDVWYGQFEDHVKDGATAPVRVSSLIFPGATAAIRSADTLSIGGTAFTRVFGASEGAFVYRLARADVYNTAASLPPYLALGLSNGASDIADPAFYGLGWSGPFFVYSAAGSNQTQSTGVQVTPNSKIAVAWTSLGADLFIDGARVVPVATDLSPILTRVNQLYIHPQASLSVSSLQMFNHRPSDDQLMAMTAP